MPKSPTLQEQHNVRKELNQMAACADYLSIREILEEDDSIEYMAASLDALAESAAQTAAELRQDFFSILGETGSSLSNEDYLKALQIIETTPDLAWMRRVLADHCHEAGYETTITGEEDHLLQAALEFHNAHKTEAEE